MAPSSEILDCADSRDKKMECLQENMSAAYVALSESDWTELEKILDRYPVSGELNFFAKRLDSFTAYERSALEAYVYGQGIHYYSCDC